MKLEIPGYSRYYLDTDDNQIYNRYGKPMGEYLAGDPFKDRRFLLLSLINDEGKPKRVRKHRVVYMAYHPERRSAKMKGIPNTSVSVEVEALVLETGKVEYYPSVASASRAMGVVPTSIWSALDNDSRISVGRKWRRHHGG